MDGWMDGWIDGLMDYWIDGQTDGLMNGWMDWALPASRSPGKEITKSQTPRHGPLMNGTWRERAVALRDGDWKTWAWKAICFRKKLKPMLPTSVGCRQRFRKTRTASRKGNDRVHQVTRTALPTMQIGMPGLLECQIWNHTFGQHLQNNYTTTT